MNGPGFLSNHFEIHEIFMRIIKIISCTIQFRQKAKHVEIERAKNKLVVGVQDLEAQVELLFYAIETNILFGWIDIDVC